MLTGALLVGRWGAGCSGRAAPFCCRAAAWRCPGVAAANLAAKGDITVDTALISVAAALGSNLIVKTVLAFTAGGRRFRDRVRGDGGSVAGFRRRAPAAVVYG